MRRPLSDSEKSRHDRLYGRACRLVEGELQVDGTPPPGPPTLRVSLKLRLAASLFRRVLKIDPDNGSAMFFLARIHLRLGEPRKCLRYLLKAGEANPMSPGIARESVIVAMEVGKPAQAIEIAVSAIRRMPDDPGLRVNLGLALLVSSRAGEAEAEFLKARELEPDNPVTPKLAVYAAKVASGESRAPKSEHEVARAIGQM